MWRRNRRELIILLAAAAVIAVWNIVNISIMRGVHADRQGLTAAEDAIRAKIHSGPGELPADRVYIDWAIRKQREANAALDKELGARFAASMFQVPDRLKLARDESPRVFFNEKSDDIKIELIKKSNANGFRINTELRFGDADENSVNDCVTMLYLVARVLDAAIDAGLQGMDGLHQNPKETVYSDFGFEFEVFRADMTFTGRAENLFAFIDGFQVHEPGAGMKQKVFLENIRIDALEKGVSARIVFVLAACKGQVPEHRKPETRRSGEAPAGAKGQKPVKKPGGIPLGI